MSRNKRRPPIDRPPVRRADKPPPMPALGLCAQCVAEHKGAMLAAADTPVGEPVELPPLAPAIMLIGGTGCCFTHLQVQTQSSLLVPNGAVQR